jgi:hypothetical protein
MALFFMSEPPDLGQFSKYNDYKDWLLTNFYYYLCSYCLLCNPNVQIDHYEPLSYASDREHDPQNLLLACPTCNGSSGKGDYHPKHDKRRRKANDNTGYFVADIRVDNFGDLFCIDPMTGALKSSLGPERERSAWNITLLKLDLPFKNEARKELCEAASVCEELIAAIEKGADNPNRDAMQAALNHLLSYLRKQRLFFTIYDIKLPIRVMVALEEDG